MAYTGILSVDGRFRLIDNCPRSPLDDRHLPHGREAIAMTRNELKNALIVLGLPIVSGETKQATSDRIQAALTEMGRVITV